MIDKVLDWPRLTGGAPSLDFVNTVDPRLTDERREYLVNYDALLQWCVHAGVVEGRTYQRLRRRASRSGHEAADVFRRTILFREALFMLIRTGISSRVVRGGVRLCVAETLRHCRQHTTFVSRDGRYAIVPIDDLELPLTVIALDAERLLTSASMGSVRMCEAPKCGWLFLDTSKNRTRRWCSMRICGNRTKARRYARRHHLHKA